MFCLSWFPNDNSYNYYIEILLSTILLPLMNLVKECYLTYSLLEILHPNLCYELNKSCLIKEFPIFIELISAPLQMKTSVSITLTL